MPIDRNLNDDNAHLWPLKVAYAVCLSENFEIWILVPIHMKFMGFIKISEVLASLNCLQLCFHNHDIPRYADNSFSSSPLFLSLSDARVQLSSSCFGSYIYILFHFLYQIYTDKKNDYKNWKRYQYDNQLKVESFICHGYELLYHHLLFKFLCIVNHESCSE